MAFKELEGRNRKLIPATKRVIEEDNRKKRKKRVAAYCRVSTDSKEQETSYESQVEYYTDLIKDNPEWDFVGIYADPAVSGTSRRGRLEFDHMLYTIQANHLPISLATVYRHTHLGYYSFITMDLPRAVKLKSRKQCKEEHIPKWAKNGRTYEAFLAYVSDNPDINVVQLDTVIGRMGGKVIMTIHFTNCDFMVGLLLDNKTASTYILRPDLSRFRKSFAIFLKIVCAILVLVVLIVVLILILVGGSPKIVDGEFVIVQHGRVVRQIPESLYVFFNILGTLQKLAMPLLFIRINITFLIHLYNRITREE